MTVPTAPEQVVPETGITETGTPETGTPVHQNQIKLRLEVTAGAHRGAALLLDEGVYRLGSSPDADIVLSDPGVAPAHAMLDISRDMMTGRAVVRIGATGGDLVVGQEKLPLSRGCRARLPVSVSLGEMGIQLSELGTPGVHRAHVRKTLTAVGFVAGAAVAVAMATQAFRASGGVDVGAPERTGSSGQQPAMLSTANASHALVVASEEAAQALSARLEAARITTVRVSAESGRLVAAGTVAGPQSAEWAAIQRWFDETYNGRIVLTTRLDPPTPRVMPTLQLQAVWYGERPYVLAADGEHYYTGAVLDNGWIIRDIGKDRLLLAKEGEAVTLTYRLSSPQVAGPQAARTNQ